MRPTDKERRAVAARLRELAQESARCGDDRVGERACRVLLGPRVDLLDVVDAHFPLARLADLIDPTDETCELELTWGGKTNAHVRTYECNKCGKSCDSVWGEDYEFCPYCGRRVENADE